MTRSSDPEPEAARFGHLWDAHASRVQSYAMRHTDPDEAQEIVAETFLVAWRRLEDVPGDPLPWLLVVARNTIQARRRSYYRRRLMEAEVVRLARAAASPYAVTAGDSAEVALDRDRFLRGLAALRPADREALLLTAWDGLDASEAARVLGCSTESFHVRLHRARKRLTSALGLDDEPGRASEARSITPVPSTETSR